MRRFTKNITLIVIGAFFTAHSTGLVAQQSDIQDRKITITEETTDASGNTTTRKITLEGDVSREDIENFLNGADLNNSSDITIRRRNRGNLRQNIPNRLNLGDRLFFQNPGQGDVFILGDKPSLGVYLNNEDGKMTVARVIGDSGADEAGIQEGDIIVSINGEKVSSIDDIRTVLKDKESGDKVNMVILRGDDEVNAEVELKNNDLTGMISRAPRWNRNNNPLFNNPQLNFMQRPKLGIMIEDSDNGVRIGDVTKDSAAEKAGLKEGDVITKFDGKDVADSDQLIDLVRKTEDGKSVEIEYTRDGKKQTATATLPGRKHRKRL